jgi:phenylalanyl-tRNA synthetase beta chain
MTISYQWLHDYLPKQIDPEKLSIILTSIGLEVESMEKKETIKGGLQGVFVGEVLTCEKHPEADKLKLTTVDIGGEKPLNIVCGASNVAAGQKVIVALSGTTIYPSTGEPITLKKAKIRGAESEGMICAEDELGLSNNHEGIIVLSESYTAGKPASEVFQIETDYIYEIGLTPNRMDAMSHRGVARDVCAYLSYHQNETIEPVVPASISIENTAMIVPEVTVKNSEACSRYCGIYINNIAVGESPDWLTKKLQSIGLKSINNIVDITNFLLHETGQPLHAFDADKIKGKKIEVKLADEGVEFIALDGKKRTLNGKELMIANESEYMCMAGVYGGLESGVSSETKNIFLESACFDPKTIRRAALHHELRTDASARFEKGVDVEQTVLVLERATSLILEVAGGSVASNVIDLYPVPFKNTIINFSWSYLQKLSGKQYDKNAVKRILTALNFVITSENEETVTLSVPSSKHDVQYQADIVEEIIRIDGLDQIPLKDTFEFIPSINNNQQAIGIKEKLSAQLGGAGFQEIFTNSITNAQFYTEETLADSVFMMNSLSSELNILRPQMVQSGLQIIAHNLNHKNNNLFFYEFGKTYHKINQEQTSEAQHLVLYLSGNLVEGNWNSKAKKADFYYLKGLVLNLLKNCGMSKVSIKTETLSPFTSCCTLMQGQKTIARFGEIDAQTRKTFDVKQPVFFADLFVDEINNAKIKPVSFKEWSKFPAVTRDLALVVDKKVSYVELEQIALAHKLDALTAVSLFDVFESEKLGVDKKSMAMSFTFRDEQKTLTDKEIDAFMEKIIKSYEKNIQAEIRK